MLEGVNHPTFCRPVELGQDQARNIGHFVKGLGLEDRILSRRGIQDQEGFQAGFPILPFDDGVDFLQLLHEVLLVVEATGRVNDQDIAGPVLGFLDPVKNYRSGIGTFFLFY